MVARNPAAPDPHHSHAHRQLKARLMADLPTPCARCGITIPAGIDSKWVHLDHVDVAVRNGGRAGEGALSHRKCNLEDAADYTNKIKRAKIAAKSRAKNSDEAPFFSVGGSDTWDPLESTCRHASLSIL